MPIGGDSPATTQSLPLTVAGGGRGTGTASLTFSVAGGVATWNGYGVGANDDPYHAAPICLSAGVIAINGAPGYNGGVPMRSRLPIFDRLQRACRSRRYATADGPLCHFTSTRGMAPRRRLVGTFRRLTAANCWPVVDIH